jgi:cold shock CspA family protein
MNSGREMFADNGAPDRGDGSVRPEDETLIKLTGTMKWFDATRGFGFLISEQAKGDILVHFSVLKEHDRRSLPKARSWNALWWSRIAGCRRARSCRST